MTQDQEIVIVSILKQILSETLEEKRTIIQEVVKENIELKDKLGQLESKVEALECYSRWNNIVIHNISLQDREDPVKLAVQIGNVVCV